MADYEIPLEDLVTAFVDAFNARDLEELGELFAPDATIDGVVEDADSVVGVLQELQERSPWMSLARGEVGLDAVAAIWVPDQNARYRPTGYFGFETDGELLSRIEIFEDLPEELLSESPSATWAIREVESTNADAADDLISTTDVD